MTFFFCVVKRMFSHAAMHILYWFTPPFLQKKEKKKYQKSTCLNKKISMFKVPSFCDLIKTPLLCGIRRRRSDGSWFFLFFPPFFPPHTPNMLSRLNRFTFHPRLLILVKRFKGGKKTFLLEGFFCFFLSFLKELKHSWGRFKVVKQQQQQRQQQQQQLWQSELPSVTDMYHGADRGRNIFNDTLTDTDRLRGPC